MVEGNKRIIKQSEIFTINKEKIKDYHDDKEIIKGSYGFMKKNIYMIDTSVDENQNGKDFNMCHVEVSNQECKFMKIDSNLNKYLGEWANGQDPKILDKNIDKIFENIKLLQQERNNSEYYEFFVERTIKEWLIEEMNRCENTNEESNNRISDTDNEDTNEMASSTDLKLQYSCPEISADFKDVLDDENINVCLPIKVDMTKIRANNSTNMNKHIKAVNGLVKK